MKTKIIFGVAIVLFSVYFINYCTSYENIYDKFNEVKVEDYSSFFDDMTLTIRGGDYYIYYHGFLYKIKRRFLTKKIYSIEEVQTLGEKEIWSEGDIKRLEKAVTSFDEMGILSVSVDSVRNVEVAIRWSDGCTYNFLRLSPKSTLEDIHKQRYQHYEDDWYLDKRCVSR